MPGKTIQPVLSLGDLRTQLAKIKSDAAEFLADLSDSQANWCPAPDRWSIAQCIDHLIVTGRQQLATIDETMAHAGKKDTSGSQIRVGFFGRMFLKSIEPPVRRRFRAPRLFLPTETRHIESLRTDFAQLQDDLVSRFEAAEGLDLNRVKMSSPAARWLRFSLGVWFASIPAHERRHIVQARSVAADPNYPRL